MQPRGKCIVGTYLPKVFHTSQDKRALFAKSNIWSQNLELQTFIICRQWRVEAVWWKTECGIHIRTTTLHLQSAQLEASFHGVFNISSLCTSYFLQDSKKFLFARKRMTYRNCEVGRWSHTARTFLQIVTETPNVSKD